MYMLKASGRGRPNTLWFVTYAFPLLDVIERGSFPGYEFEVCIDSAVLDGDVKRILSRGNGTRLLEPSSMTQLVTQIIVSLVTVD